MKKIASFTRRSLAVVASVLTLGGCTFSNDALFPSLMGTEMQEDVAADSRVVDNTLPVLGSSNFEPIEVSKGGNTGTFVGQKVATFRKELSQLQTAIRNHNDELQKVRSSIVSNALQYHKSTAAMEAKLQVGTTPGNPHMFAMMQSAQNNVQVMGASTVALNQLSNKASSDAAMTSYLLDSIRSTYSVSGAVDEDHRQLRILENETSQTSIVINSLVAEINADASRQQQYVETANNHLLSLDGAIRQGNYGGSSAYTASRAGSVYNSSMSAPVTPINTSIIPSGKPLFTAKFNRADVKYKDSLKSAVSAAKAKKPNAMFDVVGVNPMQGNTSARDYASRVFQDMVDMGVGADKIALSAKTSAEAKSPEVQVFVR